MPNAYPAHLGYFGFGLQSVLGTAVAPTIFPRWQNPSFHPAIKPQTITEGDMSRVAGFTIKNQQMWAGAISTYPRPVELGWILARFCGVDPDTVTGSGDPYTHGLIPHAVPPATGGPYMTVERGFAGTELIDRVQDCVIDQIEIEGEAGRPIMFTLTMQGIKSEAQSSAATVTLEAGNLIPLFYQGTYSLGGATTGAAAQIQKFKFTFSNHHAIVQSESFTPDLLLPTELEARGEFDVVFYDKALYRKVYKNASTSDSYLVGSDALSFTFTMQGSPARQLVIAIGKAEYVTAQPNPALNTEELKQHVVWNAVRPSALTDFLQFAVLNAQSTAY